MIARALAHTALVVVSLHATAPTQEKVSEFGRYEGYSEARFSKWSTTSRYLEMRDGVKLAVDITRPTEDGIPVTEKLPVLWTHSRYHRNPSALVRALRPGTPAGRVVSMVDSRPDLQRLVRHGYVFVAVSVRGSGASFGRFEGLFSEAETKDAGEVIAWLVAQPWCDGNVGMWGASYLGITQYMAASLAPPGLKAIFPDVAALDLYELLYPGGVFREDMIRHWDVLTDRLDLELTAPPVDADAEGEMLKAAIADHRSNWQVLDNYRAAPFRDHATDSLDWSAHGPSGVLDEIKAARIPCYYIGGWFDVFVLDAVLFYANYSGPQRLTIGPWSHGGMKDPRYLAERMRVTSAEQHRWFDYWLKGIQNGVTDEPPIRYAVHVEPGEWRWRTADSWPPAGTESIFRWFAGGPSGSIDSTNDGILSTSPPGATESYDDYAIDPTTTTGNRSRWDNAVGAAPQMAYEELADNDRKALTYTTPPLESDLTVVGHPLVTLHVTATDGDADFYVVLEEVDEHGAVRYVTEGVLRGSHRKLAKAPWDNLGLPFQRSFAEDRESLPADEPTAMLLDLLPTATVFDAGHRIRVSIFCADADNTERPPVSAPARIRLFRDAARASGISLPTVPG